MKELLARCCASCFFANNPTHYMWKSLTHFGSTEEFRICVPSTWSWIQQCGQWEQNCVRCFASLWFFDVDRQTDTADGPSPPGREPTEVDPLWQRRMTTLLHVSRTREGPSIERKSLAVKDMEAWVGIYISAPWVKEKKGEKEGFRKTPESGEEYCSLWPGALVP